MDIMLTFTITNSKKIHFSLSLVVVSSVMTITTTTMLITPIFDTLSTLLHLQILQTTHDPHSIILLHSNDVHVIINYMHPSLDHISLNPHLLLHLVHAQNVHLPDRNVNIVLNPNLNANRFTHDVSESNAILQLLHFTILPIYSTYSTLDSILECYSPLECLIN